MQPWEKKKLIQRVMEVFLFPGNIFIVFAAKWTWINEAPCFKFPSSATKREARPGTQCLLSEEAVNNVNGNEEEPELALSVLHWVTPCGGHKLSVCPSARGRSVFAACAHRALRIYAPLKCGNLAVFFGFFFQMKKYYLLARGDEHAKLQLGLLASLCCSPAWLFVYICREKKKN